MRFFVLRTIASLIFIPTVLLFCTVSIIKPLALHNAGDRRNAVPCAALGCMKFALVFLQVIINLVDNAIKYTPVGSVIEIHTDQKEQWVTVSVSDNGPGIPDEQKPRIFDMFYSGANKVVDSRRSLGLGLSLCKSIVTAHGGTISVSDNQPNGTVFTFTLPAGAVELHE